MGQRWNLSYLAALGLVLLPGKSDGATLLSSGNFFAFDLVTGHHNQVQLSANLDGVRLFSGTVREQDAGTLFRSFIGSAPGIAPFVSRLTDDEDGIFEVRVSDSTEFHFHLEWDVFGLGPRGLDPQRLEIEQIDVYLDSVDIVLVGPLPDFPGLMSTESRISGRIELIGTIPEPGSTALLATALFSICLARRRLR